MEHEIEPPLVRASRRAGVYDERVLAAMAAIRRECFVPARDRFYAFEDEPIVLPHGQVTTQPSLVAKMCEALELQGHERVLEVGTGYAYQAAVLSRLASEVVTIERFWDFCEMARRNLARARIDNVEVVHGDGSQGYPPRAPYDAIIVAAASPEVPQPLIEQLVEGGRLVQPMGYGGDEVVTAFRKEGGKLVEAAVVTLAYFVTLVTEMGQGEMREGWDF